MKKFILILAFFSSVLTKTLAADFSIKAWEKTIEKTNGFSLKVVIEGVWAEFTNLSVRPGLLSSKSEPLAVFLDSYYSAFASGDAKQLGMVMKPSSEISLGKIAEVKDPGPDVCILHRALRFGRWDFAGLELNAKKFRRDDGGSGLETFTYMEIAREGAKYLIDLNMGSSPLNLLLGAMESPKSAQGKWLDISKFEADKKNFWVVTNLAGAEWAGKPEGTALVAISGYQTNRPLGKFTVQEINDLSSVENAWAAWMVAMRDDSRRKIAGMIDSQEKTQVINSKMRHQSTFDYTVDVMQNNNAESLNRTYHLFDEFYLHGVIDAGEYRAVVYSRRPDFVPFAKDVGNWLWFHKESGSWHVTDWPNSKMTAYEVLYLVMGVNGYFTADPIVFPIN